MHKSTICGEEPDLPSKKLNLLIWNLTENHGNSLRSTNKTMIYFTTLNAILPKTRGGQVHESNNFCDEQPNLSWKGWWNRSWSCLLTSDCCHGFWWSLWWRIPTLVLLVKTVSLPWHFLALSQNATGFLCQMCGEICKVCNIKIYTWQWIAMT